MGLDVCKVSTRTDSGLQILLQAGEDLMIVTERGSLKVDFATVKEFVNSVDAPKAKAKKVVEESPEDETEDGEDVVPDAKTKAAPEKKDEWDMPERAEKKTRGKGASAKAQQKESATEQAATGGSGKKNESTKKAKGLPEPVDEDEDIEIDDDSEDESEPSLADQCIDLQRACETEEDEAKFEKAFLQLLKDRNARSVVDVKDPEKFLAQLKKAL